MHLLMILLAGVFVRVQGVYTISGLIPNYRVTLTRHVSSSRWLVTLACHVSSSRSAVQYFSTAINAMLVRALLGI